MRDFSYPVLPGDKRGVGRRHRLVHTLFTGVTCLLLHSTAHALDVNQATAEELEKLRGLGAKTAALIVKERARGGAYESMENLVERVKGLGTKKMRALQALGLRAGTGAAGQAAGRTSPPGVSTTVPRSAPAGPEGAPRPRRPLPATRSPAAP